MEYKAASESVLLTARELVALLHSDTEDAAAAPGFNTLSVCPELRASVTGSGSPVSFHCPLEAGGHRFELRAEADAVTDGGLLFLRLLPDDAPPPPEAPLPHGDADDPWDREIRLARAEAYCAAWLYRIASGSENRRSPTPLRILWLSRDGVERHRLEESPAPSALRRFFERLLAPLDGAAAEEIDRTVRRLPALAALRFPFPHVREGQAELMAACRAAMRGGRRLYASAPTGIGKTVSVLYPALRSLGEGRFDKIFYLTPKATVARAAADTIALFRRTGAPLRAVSLCARENLCGPAPACASGACPLSRRGERQLSSLTAALLARADRDPAFPAVADAAVFREAARAEGVCPYRLSMYYSRFCDVIICDYNYLFDPRTALRRYFSPSGEGGRFCFLVDEAHNLAERAREMVSDALSLSEFDAALVALPPSELREALAGVRTRFAKILLSALKSEMQTDAQGVRYAFASTDALPAALASSLRRLSEMGMRQVLGARGAWSEELYDALSGFFSHLCDFCACMTSAEEQRGFVYFYRRVGRQLSLELNCLDPGEVVSGRLSLGQSAVLFSATLAPLDYYAAVLGCRAGDRTLELASPFEAENLCVAVMDKLPTRQSARESTLRPIVTAIRATVAAKPGNYLVFAPSFAYAEALYRTFSATPTRGLRIRLQERVMSAQARAALLAEFDDTDTPLVAFCVMGGLFGEGVDLAGRRLIGAIVIGVGMPSPSDEREAMAAYFEEKYEAGRRFAYVYPGMNRVLQAAGRVIRDERDRGVVVLIDDRYAEPEYKRLLPRHWRGLHYVGDSRALHEYLCRFWGTPSKNKPKT